MGLGDIGGELARVSKAFGMRVVGLVSSRERYEHMLRAGAVDELFETHRSGHQGRGVRIPHLISLNRSDTRSWTSLLVQDIDAFLSRCDYFVNALPSTPQTKGLLGSLEFAACKPGAVFINIGRGDILNEDANGVDAVGHEKRQEGDVVLEALERGHIAGAVLDVFKSEPLAPSSRLWTAHPEELVVTPHVAAISLSRDVAQLFRQNLVRYVEGRDLLFPVDWHKGY
jgi:phosphoglycerate dehydrogenase-like enzyme